MKSLRYLLVLLCFVAFGATAATTHSHPSHGVAKHKTGHVTKAKPKKPVSVAMAKRPVMRPLGLTLESPAEECMARAIYHEARGQGEKGMAGVGYVTLNRVGRTAFPSTLCGVVLQDTRSRGKPRRCEFTWVCAPLPVSDAREYAEAKRVAAGVLTGTIPNPVRHAIYFNVATRTQPPTKTARFVVRIGGQKFYEDKDRSSLPPATRSAPALLADS